MPEPGFVADSPATSLAENCTGSEMAGCETFSSATTLNGDDLAAEGSQNFQLVMHKGIVYDVSSFVTSHPGGADVIKDFVNNLSIDIADVMTDPDQHAHSDAAFAMLRRMPIVKLSSESPFFKNTLSSRTAETRQYLVRRKNIFQKPENENATIDSEFSDDAEIPPLVDFSKPLMYQILKLDITRDEYLQRMHAARHLGKPARFFESDFLEMFSRTPWYLVPAIWLPIIVVLVLNSANTLIAHPAVCFASGMILWSILEYIFHRFIFHVDERLPENKYAFAFHFLLHGVHHHLPMDEMRLVLPPIVTAFFFSGPSALVLSIFDRASAYALIAGGLAGYLIYDMTHYYIHHASHRWMPTFMQHMKKRHMLHHYADPARSFGISTDLWDRYFSTY